MIALEDLENKDFKKSNFRGYNTDEVDYFIKEVVTAHKYLKRENEELRAKMAKLTANMNYYQSMEHTIQNALIQAEKTAQETTKAAMVNAEQMHIQAKEKAQLIQKQAQHKADIVSKLAQEKAQAVLSRATDAVTRQQAQVNELRTFFYNYKNQIKDFMTVQVKLLEETGGRIEEEILSIEMLSELQLENIIEQSEMIPFSLEEPELSPVVVEEPEIFDDIINNELSDVFIATNISEVYGGA